MRKNDIDASKSILTALGRTTLLVRDQDEAIGFYCDKLGFEILHDSTSPDGFRALHIGLPGQPQEPRVGLWLITAQGVEEQALVGRQAGREPMFVVYTDDCKHAAATLAERGVKFRITPQEKPGAIVAHFLDLYGNELVLAELLGD